MATNLQIDDKLINKAVRLGGHRSKKAAELRNLIADHRVDPYPSNPR